MTNRFAEMENTIRLSRRSRKARRAAARKRATQDVADKGAEAYSPASRALGKRRAVPLSMMLPMPPRQRRVRSFAVPVDYAIPGPIDVMAQPNAMGCWATVFTMMYGWKVQQSMPIEYALGAVGQKWVDMFTAGKGLSSADKTTFLAEAGLVAVAPQSFSVEGWENLLRNYGPIWVTTDEDPGPKFSIHARIITAIRGDGTAEGTRIHVIDPGGGREYDETIADFIPKYESEVRATGHMRIQIVHWNAGAQNSQSQSLSRRSFAHAARPPRLAPPLRRTRAFSQESLEATRAQIIASGVPAAEVDAFLASIQGTSVGMARARALSNKPFEIILPSVSILKDWQVTALLAALSLSAPWFAPMIPLAMTAANSFGVTIGVGPSISGGLVVGAGLGIGVLFAPGNKVGAYGSVSGIGGIIASISATCQLTVVKGGPDVFGGKSLAVGVSVDLGEGPSVAGHALFTTDGKFNGVTAEVGLTAGIPLPFEAFAQYQYTGVAMANALGVVPGTFARVLAFGGIPLDPGAGGRSIGVDALEPGDIILSTTSETVSRVIRGATGSEVSHAAIYVGNGEMAEALGDGVSIKPVATGIMDDSVAVAFRYPGLTAQQAQQVSDFARGAAGRKYDYWGVIDQARYKLAPAFCATLGAGARAQCESWVGSVDLGTSRNDSFYCSELVIAAYQAAGVQLTNGSVQTQSPEDIAQLRLTNTLQYVGHLKTS
jgi:uncharacterized protein YycO